MFNRSDKKFRDFLYSFYRKYDANHDGWPVLRSPCLTADQAPWMQASSRCCWRI